MTGWDDNFDNLNQSLLTCINTGLRDMQLKACNPVSSDKDKKRHLTNKLRMLANMIDEGLLDDTDDTDDTDDRDDT